MMRHAMAQATNAIATALKRELLSAPLSSSAPAVGAIVTVSVTVVGSLIADTVSVGSGKLAVTKAAMMFVKRSV